MRKPFVAVWLLLLGYASSVQAIEEVVQIRQTQSRTDEFDLNKNEFKHESRFGFVIETGNSQSETLSGSTYTLFRDHRWEHKWKLGALLDRVFSSTDTDGSIDVFIYGSYRIDYYFTDRLSYYFGGGGFTDEITGIDVAASGFNGVSYFFWRNQNTYLRGSLGYTFVFEDQVFPNPSQNIHSAYEELEFSYLFNKHVSFFLNAGAFENVQDGRDVRAVAEASIKARIANHFGIVTGFRLRFDNQPVTGFEKLDTITDVSFSVTF